MSFFLKKRFSAKPAAPRMPNLGHPHLVGCRIFVPFLANAGAARDIYSGRYYAATNGPSWSVAKGEISGFLPANNQSFRGPPTYDFSNGEFTIYSSFLTMRTTASQIFGRSDDSDGNRTVRVSWDDSDNSQFLVGNSGGSWANDSVFWDSAHTAGRRYEMFHYFSASTLKNIKGAYSLDPLTKQWNTGIASNITDGIKATPADIAIAATDGTIGIGHPAGCWLFQTRIYDRVLSEELCREIAFDPWAPFERRVFIPVDIGITPIGLSVENLAHTSPIDSVNVESSYILQIDGANHASPLDECAVTLSEAITLLIDGMAHGSVLDEPLITPTYTLLPQALAHAHPLDECAAYWRVDLLANGLAHVNRIDIVDVQAAPEIVIDVDAMTHGHALDAIALEYETTFIVDGLRHGHPVDAPDVSALLGLLTTVQRTDTIWRINAGQSVDNAAGVDGLWHVVEAIFDGAGSILSIDGAPVAGNAGVRELNSLTLGAELDGGERLTGDVGELRIYNGALTQTQRDKIRAELQAKWL